MPKEKITPTPETKLIDWRCWNNWDHNSLEAVDLINELLKTHKLEINIDWNKGDDFTEVSIQPTK
jgi:hypothetical protein